MRTASLSIAGAAALVLASLSSSFASDVNCGIVMKSVKMGRSAQDIAETMMISTDDVEKCKKEAAEAPKEGQAAGGEKPAAEKKPEAGGAH
ncbi:MAG: hypothetical protein IT293_11060 [Deltaproteobacteria bacterium]|nr:hypothetical protein [Deltaproteobacteria bacterium]